MVLNTLQALAGAALLCVASARSLTPIEDLSKIIPGHPVKRSLPNDEVFKPHNEYVFHYAQAGKKSYEARTMAHLLIPSRRQVCHDRRFQAAGPWRI
jgi:hypothetical protein